MRGAGFVPKQHTPFQWFGQNGVDELARKIQLLRGELRGSRAQLKWHDPPATFAEGMGQLGIGDETPVVAYDDAGGVIAARLVWMLRMIGHPAALLDGGWEQGEHVPDAPAISPAMFSPTPWPLNRLARPDELTNTDAIVIDARPRQRFLGAAHVDRGARDG